MEKTNVSIEEFVNVVANIYQHNGRTDKGNQDLSAYMTLGKVLFGNSFTDKILSELEKRGL